jgi:hypothetical protein
VSLLAVVEAMAAALEPLKDDVPDLQIVAGMNQNPTPPSIDFYPDTPFLSGSGFGDDAEFYMLVRARTTFADSIAGQQALYRLLDPAGPGSVIAALHADQTLGGAAQTLAVVEEGVSGFTEFLEDAQHGGRLVGCTWRVRVIL